MNGYPDLIIKKTIARKLKDFALPPSQVVKKCPVYLHLPSFGTPLIRYENKISKPMWKNAFLQ